MTIRRRAVLFSAASLALLPPVPARAGGTANVYTYRQPSLIEPLFKAFTARTGIAVRAVFADNGLVDEVGFND